MDKIPIASNSFTAVHALKHAEPKVKDTDSNLPEPPAAAAAAALPATPTAATPVAAAPPAPATMPARADPALNPYMFVPAPQMMPPMMPQMMMPPMMPQMMPQMQMMPPMFPPMFPQMFPQMVPQMVNTPATVTSLTELAGTHHVDPPSSPVSVQVDCDISEWCARYKLDAEIEAGLERLGFVVGDNLDEVTAMEYGEAGFKALTWRRVLKAYHRYRRDRK
jgi:hypothetical protein